MEATQDDSVANEKWSKVFGVNFPEEELNQLHESFIVRKESPNERFIEHAYNGKVDNENHLSIDEFLIIQIYFFIQTNGERIKIWNNKTCHSSHYREISSHYRVFYPILQAEDDFTIIRSLVPGGPAARSIT